MLGGVDGPGWGQAGAHGRLVSAGEAEIGNVPQPAAVTVTIVTHPIEPVIRELVKRAGPDVLVPILRDHMQHCDGEATLEIIISLLSRDGGEHLKLACSILHTWGDKHIEVGVAKRIPSAIDAVFEQLVLAQNTAALRAWTQRYDFTAAQARRIEHLQDKVIQARCKIAIVERTEERIALGEEAGIDAQLTWARQDAEYRVWLTSQTWFNPTLVGVEPDTYLPETIDWTWADHFARLIANYTNFDERGRAALRRRLKVMERNSRVDDAVLSLWGSIPVGELDEHVRSTYMADDEMYEPAWVVLKNLFGALGKSGSFAVWGDEATLQTALSYPRTRLAALRSKHLHGGELTAEVAAVMANYGLVMPGEAAALCANEWLTPADADRLSVRAGGTDLYALWRAKLSPEARAAILLRDVGLVEVLYLLHHSCKVSGIDLGSIGVWFDLDVIDAFIRGQASYEIASVAYTRYANVAIDIHPQTREAFARGARTWGELYGAVAEAIADVIASTNQPELISGLLLRWSGTVGTLYNAAEKI